MKLTHVRIKDFRSFFGVHDLPLGDGVNYLVGPNNCGKSNLVRGVALALDPDAEYEFSRDQPAREKALGRSLESRISLTFEVGNSTPEKTLLRYARDYEMAVRKAHGATTTRRIQTFAKDGQIVLATSFMSDGSRRVRFGVKGQRLAGVGIAEGERRKLESQFRKVVRFAIIRTGEDLESLLRGKFREILQLVISDHLKAEMSSAEDSRVKYIESLQAQLLEPLRDRVGDLVGQMFPEITVSHLVPDVPSVSETLSSVDVRLGDASALTQLTDKGTGVRGAVLVAMLQYLAQRSLRSLVLAVEEPESFLHPAGQEAIKEHLEVLATPTDVSLLVSTHSPFTISRRDDALIMELSKDSDGWTSLVSSSNGDQDRAPLLGSLYRDAGMAHVLERALDIPPSARGVLVTEGYMDGAFLRLAIEAVGRPELLDGVHIIESRGAKGVVIQAVLAESATALPVVALLDFDAPGRSARDKLQSFGWKASGSILSLAAWPGRCANDHDVEIEDLIPQAVAKKVTAKLGEALAIDELTECISKKGKRSHLAYSTAWKAAALVELPKHLKRKDAADLVWLAEELNKRLTTLGTIRA